jgi:hypothetical protein
MADALLNYFAKTPHSIIVQAAFDLTGTGVTIPMATLIAACETGPLRQLLSGYTDASCTGLGFTNSDNNRKKLRIYRVSGSASLGTVLAGSAEASFVSGSGLVITALPTGQIGTACNANFEIRFLNSVSR